MRGVILQVPRCHLTGNRSVWEVKGCHESKEIFTVSFLKDYLEKKRFKLCNLSPEQFGKVLTHEVLVSTCFTFRCRLAFFQGVLLGLVAGAVSEHHLHSVELGWPMESFGVLSGVYRHGNWISTESTVCVGG